MNCHTQVQPVDNLGRVRPAMQTLLDHWDRQEPIRWVKVNDLADFAYFNHSRHTTSGVACQECHGPVETMRHMKREYGLKMSWCLDCHWQEPPEDSKAEERGWTTRAPFHCTTCHR
jgi:hypothetical protein